MCALSLPVRRHWAMNWPCERFMIRDGHEHRERHRDQRDQRQQRRDPEHHRQHRDDGEQRGEQLAHRLLEGLADVVDVVGDPAHQLAARLLVEVLQRQRVDLVLDVGAHPAHGPLDDVVEEVALAPRQDRADDVHADDLEQDRADGVEVDRPVGEEGVEDQVGGVAEQPRTVGQQEDADHGEADHGVARGGARAPSGGSAAWPTGRRSSPSGRPAAAHRAATGAAHRRLDALGLLHRGAALGGGSRRRGRHAASSAVSWDSTISW